jgi:hypothetical protein
MADEHVVCDEHALADFDVDSYARADEDESADP